MFGSTNGIDTKVKKEDSTVQSLKYLYPLELSLTHVQRFKRPKK